MPENNDALSTFYSGWEEYQGHLVKALTPLTAEQLALRAAPNLRPISGLIAHMIVARAGWMSRMLGEGGEEIAALAHWNAPDAAPRTAADLVNGLESTWRCIRACLDRWTPADMAQTFTRSRQQQTSTVSRQWVIWHLIEHDLHHGGEFSFTLGMHGLAAPDL